MWVHVFSLTEKYQLAKCTGYKSICDSKNYLTQDKAQIVIRKLEIKENEIMMLHITVKDPNVVVWAMACWKLIPRNGEPCWTLQKNKLWVTLDICKRVLLYHHFVFALIKMSMRQL